MNEEKTSCIVHELGHCIGLEHSENDSSIMYPTIFSDSLSKNDKRNFLSQIKKIRKVHKNANRYQKKEIFE